MLVHWCMCMAVYPFFGTVADAVGRLLRLQGTAGAAQVQRRLRERFGERETVARAARRILRAYIDWGVLVETDEKGLYRRAAKRVIGDASLAVWAIRAVLFRCGRQPSIGVRPAPRAATVPFRCSVTFGDGGRSLRGFGDFPAWA